jgi:hypothetical protein
VSAGAPPAAEQQQQQQQPQSCLSRLSGAGSLSSRARGSSSGGGGGSARVNRGSGPYSEALLSSPVHTPTAADAPAVVTHGPGVLPSSQGAADWALPR